MKKAMLAGLMMMAMGCSGIQEVGIAVEGDKPGDPPHYQVLREKLASRFFAQNMQVAEDYHCKGRYTSEQMAQLRQFVDEPSWYYGCKLRTQPKDVVPVVASQSTMTQVSGPISAMALGAGLGAGLAFSGDDTNIQQNGGGASATGGSATAGAKASSSSIAKSSSSAKVSGIRGHHK